MPLYFPRSQKEENFSKKNLPVDIGILGIYIGIYFVLKVYGQVDWGKRHSSMSPWEGTRVVN